MRLSDIVKKYKIEEKSMHRLLLDEVSPDYSMFDAETIRDWLQVTLKGNRKTAGKRNIERYLQRLKPKPVTEVKQLPDHMKYVLHNNQLYELPKRLLEVPISKNTVAGIRREQYQRDKLYGMRDIISETFINPKRHLCRFRTDNENTPWIKRTGYYDLDISGPGSLTKINKYRTDQWLIAKQLESKQEGELTITKILAWNTAAIRRLEMSSKTLEPEPMWLVIGPFTHSITKTPEAGIRGMYTKQKNKTIKELIAA